MEDGGCQYYYEPTSNSLEQDEELTAHGGLALLVEYNHGIGLRTLADRHLPGRGSNRGYAASAFVDSLALLLQAGGRRLEDLRELRRRKAPRTCLPGTISAARRRTSTRS